ncbi:MAG: hypothetical protein HOO95_01295 [Gallionella sp.]|nr:hypothetical protein [Gallionella sp.]
MLKFIGALNNWEKMFFITAFNSRNADLISICISRSAARLRRTRYGLWAMCCLMPCLAGAVQIGDILTMSKLGEPLRVEVALAASGNELVDESCVSLVTPDSRTDDASNYLRDTKLSVQTIGGQQRILLSSRKPFNDVFGKFKLQIKCQDQGSIAKTFTILPDMADSSPLLEPAVSVVEHPAEPQAKVDPVHPAQPASLAIDSPVVSLPVTVTKDSTRSHRVKHPSRAAKNSLANRRLRKDSSDSFQLKISGEPLDASRIGKISPEERDFLLGSQKLLDSDDQMASILTLQNQVKQLQEDISDMRAKLARLGLPAHIATGNEAGARAENISIQAESTSTPVELSAKQAVVVQTLTEGRKSDWLTWAWQLGLLGLAIVASVWGLRRYDRSKSLAAPVQIFPEIVQIHPAPTVEPMPSQQPASPGETTVKIKAMAQAAVAAKANASQDTSATFAKVVHDEQEVDAIIEEAQLYAAFNHPQRAVKILLELLVDNPKKSDAWLLLLAILASLNNVHEFENNARAFLRYNPQDIESWKTIQILGRTLNPDNPLYRDNGPALSPDTVLGERHLLGDVLIDLEMISPESLHHCLAHFDAKKHGRLGVYLVTEKVITHKQLTEALVHQNTLNQGTPYVAPVDLEFEAPDRTWRG